MKALRLSFILLKLHQELHFLFDLFSFYQILLFPRTYLRTYRPVFFLNIHGFNIFHFLNVRES